MNINCTLSYTLGRKHFCLKLFIVDIKVTNVSFVLLKISSKQSCTDQQQKKISLIIGCHIFKRRYILKNGNILFTCNGCQKEGVCTSAVVGVEDEEADKYFLI